jgi:hypothetical protein
MVSFECIQCGRDTKTNGAAVLVDNDIRRVHMGLCYAQLCLEHQDVCENSGLDIEDIKNYIAQHNGSIE